MPATDHFSSPVLQVVADHPRVPGGHDLLAGGSVPHDRACRTRRSTAASSPTRASRWPRRARGSWSPSISSRTRTTMPSAMIGETPVPKFAGRDRRRHLVPPEFLAGQVVADQPARAEVRHDPLAVGRRRGRGRAALGLVVRLDLLGRRLGPPGLLAVGAVVGDRVELAAVEGREDELVAGDDRRREARSGPATFHFTFLSGPNSTGGFWPSATPEPFGPRNCGQASGSSGDSRRRQRALPPA